jgi:hypothetical protein
MASLEYPDKEEYYVLRIDDTRAADKLRAILRQPAGQGFTNLGLTFDSKFASLPPALSYTHQAYSQ